MLVRPQRENSSIVSLDFYSLCCVNGEAAAKCPITEAFWGITTVIQLQKTLELAFITVTEWCRDCRAPPGRKDRRGKGAPW